MMSMKWIIKCLFCSSVGCSVAMFFHLLASKEATDVDVFIDMAD